MLLRPSKYSKPLFTQSYYECDIYGGRGRGGSHNMTLFALYAMITSSYFRGYFVRAIQGTVRDSLWQDFKDRIAEISELNNYNYLNDFKIIDTDMTAVYLPNGNTIKSKGFKASSKSNTANMKSIAGATHVMIEECEEVGQEEYNKLADSLRTIKAPVKIIRSWNSPPKEHWLVKDYYNCLKSEFDGYYTLESKGINNHLSIFGTYLDNIKNLDSNTVARYKRYQETQPRYYYNQILGLVPDGGDSKVYYDWRPISKENFDKIDGVEAYGVDFGDTAPTSLVHTKYKDGCFYRRELLYESLRSLNEKYKNELEKVRDNIGTYAEEDQYNIWSKHKGVISHVFDLIKVSKDIVMFCDPAQSGLIIELRHAGFNAVAARKEKSANINFINRAINYYTTDSFNLEAEYNTYCLEVDVNKNPIDGKPRKSNDHLMDAQEYSCRGLKDEYGIIL
jgi:phage terminase large subunit